jgi:hypothetical protein
VTEDHLTCGVLNAAHYVEHSTLESVTYDMLQCIPLCTLLWLWSVVDLKLITVSIVSWLLQGQQDPTHEVARWQQP